MKGRIRYSLIYMGVIAALFAVYFTMRVFEGEMADQLKSQLRENLRLIETAYVGEKLGDEPRNLAKFASKDLRITLIDSKGGILYDSDAEAVKMENHNDREEVIDAFAKGAGEDLRYSSTLQAKVFYFAKRLNDGNVLRLGMRQANLQQVFSKTIPYLIVLLAAIVAASILIAIGLSRAFISPLQKLVDQLGTPELMSIENVYKAGKSDESYDIRKLVTQTTWSTGNPGAATGRERNNEDRAFANFRQNYIVYRLTDVMLMKAEAMVQLAVDENDTLLRQAFNIVKAVNDRSIYEGSLSNDSLKWGNYNTLDRMENLVLNERLRELCFEGKRWYDLMRYGYRKMENVDYTTTLARQQEQGKTLPNVSRDMMSLMTRKYTSGGTSVSAKMRTEPYLYMPIIENEIKANDLLKQNPAYSSSDQWEKNY